MNQEQEIETWLRISTRRVIGSFLDALARSHGWQKVFLISPWISEFGDAGGMTFRQLLKRFTDDDATVYVVSRPPVEQFHVAALEQLASTGKANVALVPSLHTKLYCADTNQGSFAMLGSANFTDQSLKNREIGALIRASGAGKQLFRRLSIEASDIYRSPDRKLFCRRKF